MWGKRDAFLLGPALRSRGAGCQPGLWTVGIYTVPQNPVRSQAGPATAPVLSMQKQTERDRAAEPGFVLYFVFGDGGSYRKAFDPRCTEG